MDDDRNIRFPLHEAHRIWYTIYMHSAERDMCMDTVFWIALLVIVVLGCIGGWMLVRQMRRQSALLRRLREQSFVLRLLEDQSPEYAMDQQYIRDIQKQLRCNAVAAQHRCSQRQLPQRRLWRGKLLRQHHSPAALLSGGWYREVWTTGG